DLILSVEPVTILLAILVSLLTIFISCYIPARRASKISAIDAIRQSEDIKLTRKNLKTSKLIRKIFGFEAEVGLKNLKRNKKRYIATVFSLGISIVLFLSVSFFVEQIEMTSSMYIDEKNYDLKVVHSSLDNPLNEDTVKHIRQLEDIDELSLLQSASMGIYLRKDKVHEQFIYDEQLDEVYVSIELIALDEEAFEKYTEELAVNRQSAQSGILINESETMEEKIGQIQPLHVEEGEELPLMYRDWHTDEEVDVNSYTIDVITDQRPTGVDRSHPGSVQMIVSEDQFKQLRADYDIIFTNEIAILTEENMEVHDQIEALCGSAYYIKNPLKEQQEQKGMMLILQIFIYGFITLITLISVANIFNTISTSIALRRREFAMLKSV